MLIKEILTATLVLFAVIDIIGSIPILLDIKEKAGRIHSLKVTITAGVLMISFLFVGEMILKLIGIDVQSFALAGALVLFFIGLEMILGISLFKNDPDMMSSASVVPIAFPLIAGAGSLTTILALKAEFHQSVIAIAILVNIVFVYIVLQFIPTLGRWLGKGGINVLRRVFGIILLAISIKIAKGNIEIILKEWWSILNS
jgi:multiple antibiotic resistance protein